LKFANSPNVEEIANERARLEIKMEAEWTKIGYSMATIHRQNKNAGNKNHRHSAVGVW
jgi:hypothetical protein